MRDMIGHCGWARLESLENRTLFSVDVLLDAAGLSATSAVTIDGVSYFFADNGLVGAELWKSDGTVAGTRPVKDLTPGPAGSKLHEPMLRAGGRAVFVTVADQHLVEAQNSADYTIWSTDGTAQGTVALARFPDAIALTPKQVGGRIAFAVVTRSGMRGADNSELFNSLLYFTDGTAAGTRLLKTFSAQQQGDVSYGLTKLKVAGDRAVFAVDPSNSFSTLWASDGTAAGTIDLTPAIGDEHIRHLNTDSNMFEASGKVIMPGDVGGMIWMTDGTLAGTLGRSFPALSGHMDMNSMTVAGDAVYFVNVGTQPDGDGIMKTLYSFNLTDGTLAERYSTPGDGSDNLITPVAVGDQVFVIDINHPPQPAVTLHVLGDSGPVKLADVPVVHQQMIYDAVGLDGVLYLALHDAYSDGIQGLNSANLWRSDGTAAGTGFVRNLFADITSIKQSVDLTPVRGKLAIKITDYVKVPVHVNGEHVGYQAAESSSTTNIYDPNELQIGRSTTSARMTSGILRLGGSTGDDNIRVWRSVRDPERLVVESNGSYRSFPFNSIRKIIADLQSGNDRFEILEGEGGLIRFRTSVFGGDGMDTIITGVGRDTISGGASGDLIRSRGNADEIMGGDGRDRINGGVGDDSIAGGSGNDQVIGAAGVDVLFGQSALEAVFGKEQEGDRVLDDVLLA